MRQNNFDKTSTCKNGFQMKLKQQAKTIAFLTALATLGPRVSANDSNTTGYDLAARHQASWDAKGFGSSYAQNCSSHGIPFGNGDFKAMMGREGKNVGLTLLKNDFWRLTHGDFNCQPRIAGKLVMSIPQLENGRLSAVQDLKDGLAVAELKDGDKSLQIKGVLFATRNVMMLTLSSTGGSADVSLSLAAQNDESVTSIQRKQSKGKPDVAEGFDNNILWITKGYTEGVEIPTAVSIAVKANTADGKSPFTVKPGKEVQIFVSIASLDKHEEYKAEAFRLLNDINSSELSKLTEEHTQWWSAYWEKSWVNIPSLPGIEKHYYQSLYGMGAASRDPEFPPSIFGWETCDYPGWNGDYHMNYNHFAPFYALYGANRIEQADPQDAPILDFIDRARDYARVCHDKSGLLYPVGIGPKGMDSTLLSEGGRHYNNPHHSDAYKDGKRLMIFGQKSNSAYAAVNLIQRWRTTQDLNYARERAYPIVKGVADYWEEHLAFEDNRYVIYKDSIHEGSGENINPILGLGLVPNVLKAALELSTALGVDADKHEKWNHILKHMSDWTFQEMDGKRVFRYTEEGTPWWKNNTLGIQHIYPANAITLDSSHELLQIAQDTAIARNAWRDKNGSNSFYPACVRVGLNPNLIIKGLQGYAKNIKPNGFQNRNPHGIENLSTTPNAVNMMMCMSVDYVLRVFPVWPKEHDATFKYIRAWGAFLVSGEQKDGVIGPVTILSEKGKDCTMINPWPGKAVQLIRDGKTAEILKGDRFTFSTTAGEVIHVQIK